MTTILVVDDDPSIRSVVSRGLRFEGYDVQVAGDGLEALRIARKIPLHMVVLDVMLPNLDGLEVCRRLRRGSNAPIIMLSSRLISMSCWRASVRCSAAPNPRAKRCWPSPICGSTLAHVRHTAA